jgi:hypothetical protein
MCRIVVCRSTKNPDRRAPQPGDVMKVVEDGVFVGKVFENEARYRVVELPGVPAADYVFLLAEQRGFGIFRGQGPGQEIASNKLQMFRSHAVDIARLEGEELALRGRTSLVATDVVLASRERVERAVSVKPHAQDPRGEG